jgi:hypothetical protein
MAHSDRGSFPKERPERLGVSSALAQVVESVSCNAKLLLPSLTPHESRGIGGAVYRRRL